MGFRSLETQVRSMHSRIAAKLKARLEAQEHDFEKASEYDKYRIWGEHNPRNRPGLPGATMR